MSKRKEFGWDLNYDCNYKCSYCSVWKEEYHQYHGTPELNIDRWVEAWNRIFRIYGSSMIYLSGGEPSVYPKFYELISRLSEKHYLIICTNLSYNVTRLLNMANVEKIKINATFHPLNADFDEFINKIIISKRILDRVSYLIYPGELERYNKMKEKLLEQEIIIHPMPVRGFNGQILNSSKEFAKIKELVGNDAYEMNTVEYLSWEKSPRGKICRTGRDYVMIRPDGHVDRCQNVKGEGLGSFFDPQFRLAEETMLCNNNHCFLPVFLNDNDSCI